MTNKLRIAGAQIPIHDRDIQANKIEIFKALDWGKENSVDIIQTPECALSGYNHEWWGENIEESQNAIKEVVDYVKKVGVGLNLGTFCLDDEYYGSIKRNQIRYYNPLGDLYAVTNKTYCVNADGPSVFNFHELKPFELPYKLNCIGLICNDMWGAPMNTGKDYMPIKALNETLNDLHVDIIFHSTNGFKFREDIDHSKGPESDKPVSGIARIETLPEEKRFIVRDMFDQWHESWLRITAFNTVSTILTVDSCVQWDWNGDIETIDKYKTASPSGILNCLGEWEVSAPRYGRHYFYGDYESNTKEKFWKLLNKKSGGSWKYTDIIDYDNSIIQTAGPKHIILP